MISVLLFLKGIRWEVWAGLALIALFLWFRAHYIGIGLERCQRAQESAQAKSIAKGQKASEKARNAATAIKIDVRQESENEAAEVREVVRYLPRTCPPIPDRVRVIGRAAVEATRASLPATKGRADP